MATLLFSLVFSSYGVVVGSSWCRRWRVGWLQFSMLRSWVRLVVIQVVSMATLLFSLAFYIWGW